jgi:RNA polymerase sigma factor (sigma-70 family)
VRLADLLRAVLGDDGPEMAPMLLRIAQQISRSTGQEMDDVLQDFLVRFVMAMRQFRGQAKLSTYLRAIANNSSVTTYRKARRARLHLRRCREIVRTRPSTTRHDHVERQVDARRALRSIVAEFSTSTIQ